MSATVFFKDEHTEEVIYSNYFLLNHPTNDLYFVTKSGQYKYIHKTVYEELSIKDNIRIPRIHYAFYKYNDYYDEWFVVDNIDRVEICADEYQDFKENTNNETNT